MRTLNRVELIGNLAADPDIRETLSGKKVANFSIATNRGWKSPQGSEKHATDYHRVVAWNKLGEICGEHLKKGSSVLIDGALRNRSYETKEGDKRYVTEIQANNINILTWKKTKNGQPEADMKPIVNEEEIDDE